MRVLTCRTLHSAPTTSVPVPLPTMVVSASNPFIASPAGDERDHLFNGTGLTLPTLADLDWTDGRRPSALLRDFLMLGMEGEGDEMGRKRCTEEGLEDFQRSQVKTEDDTDSQIANARPRQGCSEYTPTPQSPRKRPKYADSYTPRPPNAWILYRSEQIRVLRKDATMIKKPQSEICWWHSP